MRVLSLLALLPSVVYTAAVQPNAKAISPQINGSSVPDQLINPSGFGAVDPKFTIDPRDGPVAINDVSAYIAREDFNGQMPDTEEVSIPPSLDVYLAVGPSGPEPLQRRFAIWGLYLSMQYMYANSFTAATIFLDYDGQEVGEIVFRPTRAGTLEAAGFDNTNVTITDPVAAASENTNSTVTGLEAPPIIQPNYKPNGKDLSTAAV